MRVEHSRALKLAGLVSGAATDLESHLDATTVVISIDDHVPQARLTGRVLLTTLRRGPGNLVFVGNDLPISYLTDLEAAATAIDPERPVKVKKASDGLPPNAVRIHVGTTSPGKSIRIVPEGYGAHVAGSTAATIRPQRPGNPIGAIYAASLGAAEVFKYTAQVRPQRRVLHRHLRFCPLSLTADLSAAPDLPHTLTLSLALIGVGAIGTGIVLLLDVMDTEGLLVAVDRQRYAPENVGTYSIGGDSDGRSRPWKVDLAQSHLSRFDVIPIRGSASELIAQIDQNVVPWLPTALTALDSPEARRDAQRVWPDRLIDAQTGDTMLGLCDYRHGVDPCMFCVFPVNRSAPSGAEVVAERLGLPVSLLADPDAVLSDADLVGRTEAQQALLRPLVGTPVCGLARAAGLSDLAAYDYMPSIPFVSLQAACLSVARLVAADLGLETVANFVQYDGLFGPQAGTVEVMKRRTECVCRDRATSIEKVRVRRRKLSS